MGIIDLQRRLREIGRIRIGEQVPTGNGKTRPTKLDVFRLTSRDRQVVEAAAERYGGTVEAWTAPDGQQWQVKTTTSEMHVVVPPGDMAHSVWYEQWTAGGCKVRCDGRWDQIADKACHCDPEARACNIHTRLSVMLPDLPGIGVWRLDTSGYYAAVELGGIVDLCATASAAGHMLPARLRLEQRSVKRPKANGDGVETRRFAVPVLDLDVHPLALAAGARVEIGEGSAGKLPAHGLTPVPELPAPQVSVAEQMAAVNEDRDRQRRSNAAEPIPSTGLRPRTAAEAAGSSGGLPQNGSNGPHCGRCGGSLAGCDVAIANGQMVHKDGCPTQGTGETSPLEEPVDAPAGNPPPAGADTAPDVRDVAILAGKAFDAARESAPRGQKTKTVERLRHALIWGLHKKRSLNDLAPHELANVAQWLADIRDGNVTYEAHETGVTFRLGDIEAPVEWADFEQEGQAA